MGRISNVTLHPADALWRHENFKAYIRAETQRCALLASLFLEVENLWEE